MESCNYSLSICVLLFGLFVGMNAQNTCDLINNHCVNGLCQLQTSGFLDCTCNAGYIKDPSNPLVCHAIPPCNLLPGTPNQQCANGYCQMQSTGQYGCSCYPGFQLSFSNFNICEDIDECVLPTTGCAVGSCANLPGTYYCTACNPGYLHDRITGKCRQQISQPSHGSSSNSLPWFFMFDWFW